MLHDFLTKSLYFIFNKDNKTYTSYIRIYVQQK